MKKIILLFITVVAFTSCNLNKTYYYKEGVKDEVEILATTDSAAYIEAYKKFVISQKVWAEMKQSFGSNSPKPLDFILYNSKHEDITNVAFTNRLEVEKSTFEMIDKLPNNVEESAKKIREEKNGIGAKYDTGGLYLSPIKVLKARFVTKEYSNYKDVSLTYKNVSTKKVTAIRFKWYGENAFSEPADMGIHSGWGGGFTDDALRAGATDDGNWSVLSRDGKKILIAYAFEVVYNDGTKWELGK